MAQSVLPLIPHWINGARIPLNHNRLGNGAGLLTASPTAELMSDSVSLE
jgi:hypothetical protein